MLGAHLPLLLELPQLRGGVCQLARQLFAAGGQLVEGDHALLIGVEQACLLLFLPRRELAQPGDLLRQDAILEACPFACPT